jgi:Mor family transcriptional regulator
MNQLLLKKTAKKHQSVVLEPFDALMEMAGFDAVCALSDLMSGCSLYIPSKKAIFQRCLEMEAMKEFNGVNLPAIAKKYGLSVRHMRRVVDENK